MMKEIFTHSLINYELCGTPVEVKPEMSVVSMTTKDFMAVDKKGLVHGGFLFSLADHAAMIAVNHPNVVLAGADVRFHLPVKVGEDLIARAEVINQSGKKFTVSTKITRNEDMVFAGTFFCIVLEKHILEK